MPFEILTCNNCSQKLRTPRNKGKLKVTCPKCKSTFLWGGLDIPTTEVFDTAKNEELQPIVEYILKASTTERLSSSENYKKNNPNHRKYAKNILSEIRLFGGNTLANLARGSNGPDYIEIVQDVARKFGVKNVDTYSIIKLEEEIISTILRDVLKKSSGQEKIDIEKALEEAGLNKKDLSSLISGSSIAALLGARMAGIVTYQISVIVANAIAKQVLGRGLQFATNAAITRSISVLLGPIGWIVTGVWTAIDIAGPAYRVTVPCVLHVAMLRQKRISERMAAPLQEAFVDD